MSWNGTVYCGWCGEKGHNRRSCERRTKTEERILEQEPEGYRAQRILRQRKWAAEAKASRSPRKCSYCKEVGHNRRSCALKKEDTSLVQKRFSDYRKLFAKQLVDLGLGPGSLVRYHNRRYGQREGSVVALITKINWDSVSHKYDDSDITSYNALRRQEKTLFSARVVSSSSESEENRWYGPPSPGQCVFIGPERLATLMPKLFSVATKEGRKYLEDLGLEVLGTSPSIAVPEDFCEQEITDEVKMTYCLIKNPEGSQERIWMSNDLWRNVRPEEHKNIKGTLSE